MARLPHVLVTVLLVSFAFAGCTSNADLAPASDGASNAGPSSESTSSSGQPPPASSPANDGRPAPQEAANVSQDATVAWQVGLQLAGTGLCSVPSASRLAPLRPEGKGIWYDSFAVDNRTIRQPYQIQIKSPLPGPHIAGFVLWFLDDAGRVIAWNGVGGGSQLSGEVPLGAATLVAFTCDGGPMQGTYHAGPPAAA